MPELELNLRDKRERFKYKFPFYRMDIKAFEYKLNKICNKSVGYLNNEKV